MQDVLQRSYLLVEFLFWGNLTCKARHASAQVMPLSDFVAPLLGSFREHCQFHGAKTTFGKCF